MDPDEIFKRFFGASFSEFGDRRFSPADDNSGNNRPGDNHHGRDLFGDLHHHMYLQMEEMNKLMQEVFRSFSIPAHMPSGTVSSTVPVLPEGSSENKPGSTARDQMLKEGEKPSPSQPPAQPSRPFFGDIFSSWHEAFIGTPGLNRIPPEERLDSDLDSKRPNSEEIADLFEQQKKFFPFSYGSKNMDIETVTTEADGVMEKHHTIHDSSGYERTTVARRMGDSGHVHIVTTIKDENGQEKKHEMWIQNFDGKISEFDKQWQGEFDKQWQGKRDTADRVLINPKPVMPVPSFPGGILSYTRGFFRKVFGF